MSSFSVPKLVAISVALAAVLLQAWPEAAPHWEWARGAAGRLPTLWDLRWLTGHLTHWSWGHLTWDLGAFALLTAVCLRLRPDRYGWCLLLAAVLVPLEVRFFQPQFSSYRGLSGLDSALFGLAVMALWQNAPDSPFWRGQRLIALLGGAGILTKTGFEVMTGTTLFAPQEPGLYLPVPSAHLTGFLSGVLAGAAVITKKGLSGVPTQQPQTA